MHPLLNTTQRRCLALGPFILVLILIILLALRVALRIVRRSRLVPPRQAAVSHGVSNSVTLTSRHQGLRFTLAFCSPKPLVANSVLLLRNRWLFGHQNRAQGSLLTLSKSKSF